MLGLTTNIGCKNSKIWLGRMSDINTYVWWYVSCNWALRSMDHLYGPGPWATSMDLDHGPPLWTWTMDHLRMDLVHVPSLWTWSSLWAQSMDHLYGPQSPYLLAKFTKKYEATVGGLTGLHHSPPQRLFDIKIWTEGYKLCKAWGGGN